MPPKKKPSKKEGKEDESTDHNIASMTLDEMKDYARLLEGEIEDMRTDCNYYQKAEDELVEFLRIAEEDLKYEEDVLLFKDVELEKLKLNFLRHLYEKKQLPKYMEHISSEKKEKLSSEISARLEEEENRHAAETKKLKSILLEKNRQLEALKVKIGMDCREAKERNEECLRDMEFSQEKTLEKTIAKYSQTKREAEDEFKKALESIKFETREGKIRGERKLNDACTLFKQKLHNYYKEITKQDLDTIKNLKNKIAKTEENIKNSKSRLEEVKEENRKWKEVAKHKINNGNTFDIVQKFDASPQRMMEALRIHEKTEKLMLKNESLEKQVKTITEQIKNLRRQFTTALGKVRSSAEMKVAFLDKKLTFILKEQEKETGIGGSRVSTYTEILSSGQSIA